MEQSGLYDYWSGVTSNPAESLNAVLGRKLERDLQFDEAALCFYYWCNLYLYEIERGLCNAGKVTSHLAKSETSCTLTEIIIGVGNYRLGHAFKKYEKNISDVRNPGVIPAHLIFDHVKQKLAAMTQFQAPVQPPPAPARDYVNPVDNLEADDSADKTGMLIIVF